MYSRVMGAIKATAIGLIVVGAVLWAVAVGLDAFIVVEAPAPDSGEADHPRAKASVDLETARERHEAGRARCYTAMVTGFQASADTLLVIVDTERAQVTWVLRYGVDAWPAVLAPTQYLVCWDTVEERVIYFQPAGFEGMEPMPDRGPVPTPQRDDRFNG